MSDRVRVYDLARELGLTSKELIELLHEEGLEVKSHASTVDPEFAELVRDHVISERQAKDEDEPEPAFSEEEEEDQEQQEEEEDEEEEEGGDEDEDEEDDEDEEEEFEEEDENELHLKPPITVRDLAEGLGKKPNELIGELMMMNIFAAINQILDVETVEKICAKHGRTFVRERRERAVKKEREPTAPVRKGVPGKPQPRPPVVAFLGHVDHGKTSLQDYIRKTHVTSDEAGGITQHIGASIVQANEQLITFLDTPGHEAFTAMRARGANSTDIVVLVVAADDGVMPQTIEAIDHAHAANVPIVVAMNKMDLPGANQDKVLLGLQQHNVMTEDWGGEVGVIRVSAITGQGVDELLERVLLEAEIMELRANPAAPCEAIVIEAQLESGMGPTANILVRDGTLHVGDVILAGSCYGRAKALIDYNGTRIKEAGPSTPVKVLGLSGVPEAGEIVIAVEDEREAKVLAEQRQATARQGDLAVSRHANLEDLFRQIEEDAREELKIILKADVRGSVEAIEDSLDKIKSAKINIKIIHSSVGEITENDVLLASASDAIIAGFHVRVMPAVQKAAKREGVQIRLYSIIYELLEQIEDAMRGRLKPEFRENPLGEAEILQIFKNSKTGKICGCRVNTGMMRIGASARVFRENEIIYNGRIQSLRRFQDDVREVRSGLECGIRLDNFEDFEVGDIIKAVSIEQIVAEL